MCMQKMGSWKNHFCGLNTWGKGGGGFPDEVTMNTVVRVLKDAGEFDRANSDETDEPFVTDEVIKYPRQWINISDEGKEDIQCRQ